MTKIVVFHALAGCDTGCCGHAIVMDPDTVEEKRYFVFDHYVDFFPDSSQLEFAQRLVEEEFGEEHVKDLDWDNCVVLDISRC